MLFRRYSAMPPNVDGKFEDCKWRKKMASIIVTLMLIGSCPTVVDYKNVKSFDITVFCVLPS